MPEMVEVSCACVRLGKELENICSKSSRTYWPLEVAVTVPSCGHRGEVIAPDSTARKRCARIMACSLKPGLCSVSVSTANTSCSRPR
eukprot:scaffold4841_cov121-Isochrysis_galbana.AAC.10